METNNKEIKRRSTFSLLFYINRTKVRKDGTCKLLCKVSIDAKSAPININAFVDPSLWNPETKRANGRSENARTVNLAIEKQTEKITGHYRHIRKSLGFVTAELVKNAVEGIGQKPFTLLALFREHNEEFRKRVGVDRKEETYESYENSYNILASFVKKRKEKEDVALRSLDREFYDDFEIFLRTDREMKPKTVHEHLYRLKKMTKRAVSQGTLRRDPYGKLHPELPRRKSRHLKLEDLKRRATFVELIRKECPNRLPYSIQHTYFLPCTREIPRMPIPSENSIVNKKDRNGKLQTNRKPCASKFESHPYAPPVEAIRTSRHDSR